MSDARYGLELRKTGGGVSDSVCLENMTRQSRFGASAKHSMGSWNISPMSEYPDKQEFNSLDRTVRDCVGDEIFEIHPIVLGGSPT